MRMTVLENLYNGNIEPTESESLKNNPKSVYTHPYFEKPLYTP